MIASAFSCGYEPTWTVAPAAHVDGLMLRRRLLAVSFLLAAIGGGWFCWRLWNARAVMQQHLTTINARAIAEKLLAEVGDGDPFPETLSGVYARGRRRLFAGRGLGTTGAGHFATNPEDRRFWSSVSDAMDLPMRSITGTCAARRLSTRGISLPIRFGVAVATWTRMSSSPTSEFTKVASSSEGWRDQGSGSLAAEFASKWRLDG